MLEEAVEVMRGAVDRRGGQPRGRHYKVENARLYTLPDEPAADLRLGFGPKAASLAARIGDGYITMSPDADAGGAVPQRRRQRGPCSGGMKVC